MHIVIAPDSFKSSVSALEAARAIAGGLEEAGWRDNQLIPIADGGEGTVEALCVATRGVIYTARVQNPLGEMTDAKWGMLPDQKTAVIEIAAASGYELLAPDRFAPMEASTYGTGEQIRTALAQGCRRFIIGLGGSATTDGGAGIAQALGFRLLDKAGEEIARGGKGLLALDRIDASQVLPELAQAQFDVACDVKNPLCGEHGAAAVYGPQKGADAGQVAELDRGLANLARVVRRDLHRDILDVLGAGAAGGAGGGLIGFLNATLMPGFPLIARESGLEEHIAHADAVFTGEGRTDSSTLYGKVPMGVAEIAARHGVPVICLSGSLQDGWKALYEHGVTACFSIADGAIPLEDAIARGKELIQETACAVGRVLRIALPRKG